MMEFPLVPCLNQFHPNNQWHPNFVMRFLTVALLALMTCCVSAEPATGQSVVLRPVDALPALKEVSRDAFYINGPVVHGLTDGMAETYYPLGDSAKYVLALVALRLADAGVIDLNEPVAKAVPELMAFNPWEVAVTPAHLLSETAGFGWPPNNLGNKAANAPLKYFLIKVRGAGQISVHDPVGWHLLAAFLKKRTGRDILSLVQEEVFSPLGIDATALRHTAPTPHWNTPLSDASFKGDAIAALLHPLMRNEDKDGRLFLSPPFHNLLGKSPIWEMHPLGAARHAGLSERRWGNRRLVYSQTDDNRDGLFFISAPGSDAIFVQPEGTHGTETLWRAALDILDRTTPPNFDRAAAIAKTQETIAVTTPGSLYDCAGTYTDLAPTALGTWQCTMDIAIDAQGRALFYASNGHSGYRTSPLSQRAANIFDPGGNPGVAGFDILQPLVFSQQGRGGYAMLGDWAFVRSDFVSYLKPKAADYLDLMIILLLSAGLHIRSKTSVQWRRFAAFALIGTTLVGVGIVGDLFFWSRVLYEMQMPWLITAWRVGLNIGLMLILALPMLAMAFIRQQNMPKEGIALLYAGPHLGLVSLAAIGLFFVTIIWGMAGTFTAY